MSIKNGDTTKDVMAPAMEMRRDLGDNVSYARRNFRLGIMEGSFAAPANDFLNPALILAGFVYAVTGSGPCWGRVNSWGVMAIAVGALIIQPILSTQDIPYNYLLLVLIGTFIVLIEHGSWSLCREESSYRSKHRVSLPDAFRRGVKWLKEDWNYRCFLGVRVSFRFSYVGLAFFIPLLMYAENYFVEINVIGRCKF